MITFSIAKEKLLNHAPESVLDERINRAEDRLLLHGKFRGTLHEIVLTAYDGVLTLPRRYGALLGAKIADRPHDLAGQWFLFMSCVADATGWSTDIGRRMGDNFPTFRSIAGSEINIYLAAEDDADDDKTMLVFDAAGNRTDLIADQSETAVAGFPVRIVKPISTGAMLLYARPTDEHPFVVVGRYDAGETTPSYTRYLFSGCGEGETSILCLCKIRHVDAVADEDPLIVENISALALAMDALQYETEADPQKAEYYMGKAVQILNQELAQGRGSREINTPRIRFSMGRSLAHAMY